MESKPRRILEAIAFVLLHGWALVTLWHHAPNGREALIAGVYAALLVLSGLMTKRFPPPLLPSLTLVAIVAVWHFLF